MLLQLVTSTAAAAAACARLRALVAPASSELLSCCCVVLQHDKRSGRKPHFTSHSSLTAAGITSALVKIPHSSSIAAAPDVHFTRTEQ